jgi:hypothetical protein
MGLLTSCTSSASLLDFPFDPAGRSLNSPASELTPQAAGRYIVFVSDRRGSQDVYLYDTTDRRLIDLPGLNSLNAIASHPAISQDGKTIVFAASREGRSGIYLYNRETLNYGTLQKISAPKCEIQRLVLTAVQLPLNRARTVSGRLWFMTVQEDHSICRLLTDDVDKRLYL